MPARPLLPSPSGACLPPRTAAFAVRAAHALRAGPPVYVLALRHAHYLPSSRGPASNATIAEAQATAVQQCAAQARARLLAVHGQPDIALQDCTWPRLIVRASACTLWPLMCARPARTASIGVTSPDTDSAPAVAPCRRPTYDRAGLRTADVPVPLGPSAPHYTYPLSHSLSVQNEVLLFSSSFFKKIRIKA